MATMVQLMEHQMVQLRADQKEQRIVRLKAPSSARMFGTDDGTSDRASEGSRVGEDEGTADGISEGAAEGSQWENQLWS